MCEDIYFIQSRQIILDHITYGPYCLPVFLFPWHLPSRAWFLAAQRTQAVVALKRGAQFFQEGDGGPAGKVFPEVVMSGREGAPCKCWCGGACSVWLTTLGEWRGWSLSSFIALDKDGFCLFPPLAWSENSSHGPVRKAVLSVEILVSFLALHHSPCNVPS